MSAPTMSTSSPPGPERAAPGAPGNELALAMAKQIEQLANQYFAGVPGPALDGPVVVPPSPPVGAPVPVAPPNPLPSALAVGGGGASPAVTAPPVPGPLQRPPLASAPIPKESD